MIKIRNLSNGVRLVLEEIPYVQSVSLGIWVKAGAVNENPEVSGISHFIEHMMFKGTSSRTAKEIAADADRIAGQSNAFTGKEATCYYIKTLAENFDAGADIISDMFMHSLFDQTEMDKERMVIFEEMKMIEDSPEDDVHDIIMELVFRGDPMEKSIIGTRDTLFRVNPQEIRKYMDEFYAADRIVVSVSGNFDEEHVAAVFEEKLCPLIRSQKEEKVVAAEYLPSYRSKVKEIEQTHLCIAVPTFHRTDENYPKLQVLNNIFGGSMSSRLFQNIREDKGLAYSVYSMASSYSKTGYFNIYAGISHEKIDQAITGIREEMKILKKTGVTSDEMEIAKQQLMGSYIYSMENTNSRMFNNGKNLLLSDRIETQEEVINGLKNVSEEDVACMIERITRPEQYSAAIISDHEVDLEEQLKR